MRNIDKQLIDVTINELVIAYKLSPSFGEMLKSNIIKRSELYDGNDVPQTNETRIIRNIDSISLFFLNRLINNIRTYSLDTKLDLSGNKGNYISSYQTLDLRSKESIRRMISKVLKGKMESVSEDVVSKATDKVVDHEIGHALQTAFSGAIGTNDITFKTFIDGLNRKYPKYFFSYNDLGFEPLTKEKNGMKVSKRNDEYKNARDYYAPNAYLTHIDEIFNEDEALYVAGINMPQMSYSVGGVFEKKVYNYDSSNFRITSYGRMMKILLGKKDAFRAMYEDSIILYITLDEFQKEAEEVFGLDEGIRLTPMMQVFGRLDTVRGSKLDKNVVPQAYELDLFFTKCLLNIVNRVLNAPKLSSESIDMLIASVLEFKDSLMTSKTQVLETHNLCDEMVKQLMLRKPKGTIKDENNQQQVYDEYLAIADKLCEAIDLQDDASYQKLISMLSDTESKIKKVSLDSLKKEMSSMTDDEKVQFFLFNMKKALIKKVPDAYRYYRSNLMNLKSGKLIDEEVTPKF